MDSRQLRYFLAVVEHGSVTRAAEKIYVAQPALSQSLRSLEAELGIELFRRVPRGMELTPAGEALVAPARQALRSSELVDQAVSRIVELEAGWLNIVCPADLSVHPLAELAAEFRSRHPHVLVNLMDPGAQTTVEELLRDAKCEVGIAHLPIEGAHTEALMLGRKTLVLGLPPDSPDPGQSPFPLEGLAGLPFVMGPRGGAVRQEIEAACATRGFTPRVVVEVDFEHDVFLLVAAGAGAALLAETDIGRAARAGVRTVRTEPELGQDFGVVFRSGVLSPAAQAFVDLAAEFAERYRTQTK